VRRRGKGKKVGSDGSSEPDSVRGEGGMEREASSSSGGAPPASGDLPTQVRRSSQEPSIVEETEEATESARIKSEPDRDALASSRYEVASASIAELPPAE
jgi:hypothetical protein